MAHLRDPEVAARLRGIRRPGVHDCLCHGAAGIVFCVLRAWVSGDEETGERRRWRCHGRSESARRHGDEPDQTDSLSTAGERNCETVIYGAEVLGRPDGCGG